MLGPTAHGTSSEAEQIFQNLQTDLELREMQVERRQQQRVGSSDQNDDVSFFVFVQVGIWRELDNVRCT
jgi:hypothetical protein